MSTPPDDARPTEPGHTAAPGAAVADAESSPAREPADHESARERELENQWKRSAADLDNLRKRAIRDIERERTAERIRVNAAWLPILDNLELALSHADGPEHSLVQGIMAIRDQAVDILRRQGFEPVDEVGVPFDPHLHEVVSVVDDPSVPPGAVAAVLRRGYGHDEGQLRPAMVTVTKRDG